MLIDFEHIEAKTIPNFKGGEKEVNARMVDDGAARIVRFVIAPGASIGWHIHEDSCEVMYLLEGKGKVIEAGGEYPLTAGQACYCPKGQGHSFVNDSETDLVLFAVVPQQ